MRSYYKGLIYFIYMLFISAMNDAIQRFLIEEMHPVSVLFFRNFFSIFFVIAYVIIMNKNVYTTRDNFFIHLIRGGALFVGMSIWVYLLQDRSIPLVHFTLVSYLIPIFILVLSYLFLNEKFVWERWLSVVLAFVGMSILIYQDILSCACNYIMLILASLLFAIIDILNKKIINKESFINMLFYSSLVASIMYLPSMLSFGFQLTTVKGILISVLLGLNANLLLLALLQSFYYADLSALAYFRFFEFIFSGFMGFIFFHEIPGMDFLLSFLFIVPLTLFLTYSEYVKNISK